jgi:hypothetical protein
MLKRDRQFIVGVYESKAELPTERVVKRRYTVASMWAAARLADPECGYTHATIETQDGNGTMLAMDTMRVVVKRENVR